MKKSFSILMMIVTAVILVSSCGESQRTYTEMLKDERKMISRLMDSLNIVVIKDYPADGVFADNEFFLTSSGLYINVVDSGNGNRAVAGSTMIICRFNFDYMSAVNKTFENVDGFANDFLPLMFRYGSDYTEGDLTTLYCQGIVEPLSLVGDSAIVKLIVPFKIGGQAQQTGGDPIYYKKLRYVFEK